jgi:serine/threonine-protein kinase
MDKSTPGSVVYEFGAFRLEPRHRLLTYVGGPRVEIVAKAFDALLYLIEHAGTVVTRDELMKALWPRTIVEDNSLNKLVAALRRALGADEYIATLPGRGYQFIADVRISDAGGAATPEARQAANESVSPAARPRWGSGILAATGAVVGAFATGVAVWAVMRPSPLALARFDVTPDGGLTVMTSSISTAISPDGESIAYLVGGIDARGGTELRLRRLDRLGTSTLLAADEGGISGPFFSPDGTQIGFRANSSSTLKRTSIEGGPATTIAKLPDLMRGASWASDGTIVFATRARDSGGLWRVRATGGEPERLTTPDPKSGTVDWWPTILPGGQAVLFTMVGASEADSSIAVLSLATGERRVLLRGGSSPRYSRTGHLLFGRAGTLFAVRFDATRLEILGDPVPVQEGVVTKANLGATEASVASNGTLLYLSGPLTATARRLVWVDVAGRETPVPTPPRAYDQLVLSPDGTHAALGIRGDKAIWITDLARGTLDRLPADLGDEEPAVLFFSADGRRVASSAIREGRQAIVWQGIDGEGAAEVLLTLDASVQAVTQGALSPDGTRFVATVKRGDLDLGVAVLGDPKSYRNFVATPASEGGAAISPDGHWIAYWSADNERPARIVYVQRFSEGGGRIAVSVGGGGLSPHWSADGSALTYGRLDGGKIVAITRVPVSGLGAPNGSPTFGKPVDLFPWKYFSSGNGQRHFDVTADGERFLVITPDPQSGETTRLVLVQNWTEELKRLVPTK